MILSIVVPVYNGEKYIERCVDSLLNQGLQPKDYEVILINDGSKDSSLSIANTYADKYTQVKVVDQKNIGLGATRNVGIKIAKGDYLYFIDVDDYLAADMLHLAIDQCITLNLDILTFKTQVAYDGSLRESDTQDKNVPALNVMSGMSYIGELSYKNEAWWYMAKREFILKTGLTFVEGRYMEDAIYTTSLFIAAKRMAHLPLDIHRYIKVPNSILTNKDPAHYVKVIYDTEFLVKEFSLLIDKVKNHRGEEKCLKRLKTRQDSFVFFMIVRVMKSPLEFKELWSMLMDIKKTGGYPIRHFIGDEYNRPVYKILTPLFNNKISLRAIFKVFKLVKN